MMTRAIAGNENIAHGGVSDFVDHLNQVLRFPQSRPDSTLRYFVLYYERKIAYIEQATI